MQRLINTHAQAERSAFAMHAGLNARPPPAAAIAVVAKEACTSLSCSFPLAILPAYKILYMKRLIKKTMPKQSGQHL